MTFMPPKNSGYYNKLDQPKKPDIELPPDFGQIIYGYYDYPSATSSNPKPNLIKHKKNKFMSVVNNIFKSKERKALEFYGLVNGDGGLTDSGALELARFIYETDTELKAKFIAKIVEEYEAEKKSN